MSNPILAALTALLQETEILLACPEPDTDTWERYQHRRQEIFSHLQDVFQQGAPPEDAALRTLLTQVLAQDQILLHDLAIHRARCREELAVVATARQALRGYTPSLQGHLLERGV